MKKTNIALLLSIAVTGYASAGENDIAQLNAAVNEKVEQIENVGMLPTSLEIETITGDIVYGEIQSTDITIEQATSKYELTPTLERYITLKDAVQVQAVGTGQVVIPPN